MGFLRFFLAIMVLISHMGTTLEGLNPGVVAVVVFYLLAGQVVYRLWKRRADLPLAQRAWWFYQDRLWRIAPMYGFVLIFGFLAWWAGSHSYFISSRPELSDWLNNLLVIPLNYYMFNGADTFTLLPPAWSLGAELQFYLLIPVLLSGSCRLALACLASMTVFVLAQTHILNTDVFGYRLLAGVGFIFICGCWLEISASKKQTSPHLVALVAIWLGMGLYVCILYLNPASRQPFNLEVALGLFLGLPAVSLLSRWKPKGAVLAAQRLTGALSYGVFLAHFPVIWLLDLWLPALSGNALAVILGSTLIALGGHLGVERPLWARYRPFLPGRSSAQATAAL